MVKIGNLEVYGIIYKITNNINGKVYIGQTTQGFGKRYGYNIKKNTHNKHLQNSINKYGEENFDIVPILDVAFSKTELDIKEDLYIVAYNCIDNGYNNKGGGSHGLFTQEVKDKISAKAKLRLANKENHPMYGKHFSEESRQKMRESQKGHKGTRNGQHHTEESKLKMSKAHKGKKLSEEHKKKIGVHSKGANNPSARKVYMYDTEYNLINIFNTVNECGMWLLENNYITTASNNPLPTLRTMISRSIKQNKTYGGFILSYEELNVVA